MPLSVLDFSVKVSGCNTDDELWDIIKSKKTTQTVLNSPRLGFPIASGVHNDATQHHCVVTNYKYHLCNDNETSSIDEAYAVLPFADVVLKKSKVDRERCGCVVASLQFPRSTLHDMLSGYYNESVYNGFSSSCSDFYESSVSHVISAGLNLGPQSVTIDAACASTLYAFDVAKDLLYSGECDSVLCVGVTIPDPSYVLGGFSQFQIIPDQNDPVGSVPFHDKSNGLCPGEAITIFVLTKPSKVPRGVVPRATILGIQTQNSGKVGVFKPHADSEAECIKGAYEKNGLSIGKTQYVECHATGTSLGDLVEYDAMQSVFGKETMPYVGSSKYNFGHTLASSAGISCAKVILAMEHGEFPPTGGLESSSASMISKLPDIVRDSNKAWNESPQGERVCGVSAFGFGGTNAHAVLTDGDSGGDSCAINTEPITFIGLAAQYGSLKDVLEFERSMYTIGNASTKFSSKRWRGLETCPTFMKDLELDAPPDGCYLNEMEIDFMKLKAFPLQKQQWITQHLLAVDTANRAIIDSGLEPGGNVAVLVGAGTDLETFRSVAAQSIAYWPKHAKNVTEAMKCIYPEGSTEKYTSCIPSLIATRISALWNFTGPSFILNEAEISAARCLSMAQMLISSGKVDKVVVAVVDMAASGESVMNTKRRCKTPVSPYTDPINGMDDECVGFSIGEGASAFVLSSQQSIPPSSRQYATMDSVHIDSDSRCSMLGALEKANINPCDISHIEMGSHGFTSDKDEHAALSSIYSDCNATVGCASSQVGYTGIASGGASLLRAVLSTWNRYIPGVPSKGKLCPPGTLVALPNSVPYTKMDKRYSAVSMAVPSQYAASIVLSDTGSFEQRSSMVLDATLKRPIRFHDSDKTRLLHTLADVRQNWSQSSSCVRKQLLLKSSLDTLQDDLAQNDGFAAWLCVNYESFETEVADLISMLRRQDDLTTPITTKGGSRLSRVNYETMPPPKISLVYGDILSAYPKMGNGLFRACPWLFDLFEFQKDQWNHDIHRTWMCKDVGLDISDQLIGGIFMSVLLTNLAQKVLKHLPPEKSCGASLGEISMLYSTTDLEEANMGQSLATLKAGVSKLIASIEAQDAPWKCMMVLCDKDKILSYISRTNGGVTSEAEKVHVVYVDTPTRVIIGGSPQNCDKLIKDVACKHISIANGISWAHTPKSKDFEDALLTLFGDVPGSNCNMELVSGWKNRVLHNTDGNPQDGVILAQHMFEMYTNGVDWPGLIQEMFDSKETANANRNILLEVSANCMRTKSTQSFRRDLECIAFDSANLDSADQLARALVHLGSLGVPLCLGFAGRGWDETSIKLASGTINRNPLTVETHEDFMRFDEIVTQPEEIMGRRELLDFAEGRIQDVFGPKYDEIDQWTKRVRLPQRDYLLVNRVTDLNATMGEYVPCSMATEYDIPYNAWFSEGGDVPWAVLVESGQCDLMLISYLGIDLKCRGDRVYRLLDTSLKFFGVAREGDTLHYNIRIKGYANNGAAILFFFEYDCYVGDNLIIEMRNGCAGFFTKEELDAGKGLIYSPSELKKRRALKPQKHPEGCVVNHVLKKIPRSGMQSLCQRKWSAALGTEFSYIDGMSFTTKRMLMIDEIIDINPSGGSVGLGSMVGVKWLSRNDWYFPCHFKDDEVLAGSLVCEGCGQLLSVYAVMLGLAKGSQNPKFVPENDTWQKVRCRGQISPHEGRLIYRVDVKKFESNPVRISADVEILDINFENGETFDPDNPYVENKYKISVHFENIAIQMVDSADVVRKLGDNKGSLKNNVNDASTTDPLALSVFGDKTSPVEKWHPWAKRPGVPPLQLMESSHGARRLCFVPFDGHPMDNDHSTNQFPFTWLNLLDFCCGDIRRCFGDSFGTGNEARMPAYELGLITRVLRVTNGAAIGQSGKGTIFAEFDCPHDAWFYKQERNYEMPYSILMEIGLQPSGFFSVWQRTFMKVGDPNVCFRNLDCTATMHRKVDARGRRICNETTVKSASVMGEMVVQSFEFKLTLEGEREPFYTGSTSFGWFLVSAFVNQVGLDKGKREDPLHEREGVKPLYNLKDKEIARCTGRLDNRLHFLDTAMTFSKGEFGMGYAYGSKNVDPADWFFACHFPFDAVMPGSLGVEGSIELCETWMSKNYSLNATPCFEMVPGVLKWKYRGQLVPKNKKMEVDIHIKEAKTVGNHIYVKYDGNLRVDGLRVYRMTDFVVRATLKQALQTKTIVSDKEGLIISSANKPSNPSMCERGGTGMSNESSTRTIATSRWVPSGTDIQKVFGNDAFEFMNAYNVCVPLYSGAMAKGIASADLVIAMANRNILASFGAGGLPLDLVDAALTKIKEGASGKPYAVNLIHSPADDMLEKGNVDLLLKHGVCTVETSAYMGLTDHVVRYRASGFDTKTGQCKHRIIAKVSRTEVAEHFMSPPPRKILNKLVSQGQITKEQAEFALTKPVADDIAVESDSGGHTDNRPIHVVFPVIAALRDRLVNKFGYKNPIRVGVGGGIGCPSAVRAAFALGAAFVVTGTVNQCTKEAGTSDTVRKLLANASYSDVTMAPAADMFERGVKLQVLRKSTMFAQRSRKLYELYEKHNGFNTMSEAELKSVVAILGKGIEEVWSETKDFYLNRIGDTEKINDAENNPKRKMALVFRWYLSKSSGWANRGDTGRKLDYQVWCGPCIGSYNDWTSGSCIDPTQQAPSVVQINLHLIYGALYNVSKPCQFL